MDMHGIIDIAVDGAELIYELTEHEIARTGMNIRYEYSPEILHRAPRWTNAVEICEARAGASRSATPENKVILNLPTTVENMHAQLLCRSALSISCRNLRNRDCAIISLHPHNDRGYGVATAELGLLAGAERVEGHPVRQRRAYRQCGYDARWP